MLSEVFLFHFHHLTLRVVLCLSKSIPAEVEANLESDQGPKVVKDIANEDNLIHVSHAVLFVNKHLDNVDDVSSDRNPVLLIYLMCVLVVLVVAPMSVLIGDLPVVVVVVKFLPLAYFHLVNE